MRKQGIKIKSLKKQKTHDLVLFSIQFFLIIPTFLELIMPIIQKRENSGISANFSGLIRIRIKEGLRDPDPYED